MNTVIDEYMTTFFEEVQPMDFYRSIFPVGELDTKDSKTKGKYTAIACELLPKEKGKKQRVYRHTITDDLEKLGELLKSKNFIIISPISYAGKSRTSDNARYIYAIAIDYDGITKRSHLEAVFDLMGRYIPRPTYCVASGTGLHFYYQFEKPIPCFQNITKQLADLKNELTRKIWNKYTTSLADKVQIESLFQGFRLAGGVAKSGERTRIFETGKPISIEELNSYVDEKYQVKEFVYKSNLTLAEAKEKYPEWYENRIKQKKPKGVWTTKQDLYYWWKRKIEVGASVGHRYFCIMCLAIYAKKAGISREQLEQDALGLVDLMEIHTTEEDNHFTEEDVIAALEMFNDNYYTFPIDTITELTQIPIEKNKRNGRKQKLHLKIARSTLEIMNEEQGKALQGRPTKQHEIELWQQSHPNGTKADCMKDTKASRSTVYKYWKS